MTPKMPETPRRRVLPDWVVAVGAAVWSGGLMATCYWPCDLHFLAWCALVPWLMVLPRLSASKAWMIGTLVGLVFYRIGLHWLFRLNGPLAGISITLFAVWMGFSFRVARMLMQRFSTAAMLWVVPLAFVGQEVLRCEALSRLRFPFLALGYSQRADSWVGQVVSLGGIYFLSFLIVGVNAAIAYALIERRRQAWYPVWFWICALMMLGTLGSLHGSDIGTPVSVACVQAEAVQNKVYVELTRQAFAGSPWPRLVVLPEHSLMDYPDESSATVRALEAMAADYQAYICVGAHISAPRAAACPYDNVALVIGPFGRMIGRQAKCVPLPFFMDGNPARSLQPVKTDIGKLGVFVCYDGLFTDHPRSLVNQGAQILLVPVMDPADWPRQEREQHAAMAPFRSVELRRCAVRANSAGVSQLIDATGRVLAARSHDQGQGVLRGSVYWCDTRTVFIRGGFWFGRMSGVFFLLGILLLTLVQWFGSRERIPA